MPFKNPADKRAYDRAYQRERYDRLTGVEYNKKLLSTRRSKALARMAQRNNKEALDG